MMDRFDGGCMKADFDIIRLQNFIYLQHHKIFPHCLTYVNVKKTIYIYICMHMDLVFTKYFQGYFSNIFSRWKTRTEERICRL